MESAERRTSEFSANAPEPREDEFTKRIERYTAAIPSSAFLAVGVGAMVLSLGAQLAGGKWGNFIAQWVPTWLIIGLYNKMVKLEGHDRHRPSAHAVISAGEASGGSGHS
jgi:hypothetical protein